MRLRTGFVVFLLLIIPWMGFAQTSSNKDKPEQIKWLTFEEAIKKNKKHKKKIFIDVYTDWCGWCKKMDKEAFTDSLVVKYINENYYAVKLNAEYPDPIKYQGKEYFNPNPTKPRTPNQLAVLLLKNEMVYPSFVILDYSNEWLNKVRGYIKADELLRILKYYGSDQYKIMTWPEYNNLKTI